MLSNLYDKTFTIINQIPTSVTNATKVAWVKNVLPHCDKVSGIYDKSSGNMFYKSNTFKVYCEDWQNFRSADFSNKGYYSVYQTEKTAYTANIGDLVIFGEIAEEAPTTIQEFNALRTKYQNNGGILTAVEVYINYKNKTIPWATNHIELIKG